MGVWSRECGVGMTLSEMEGTEIGGREPLPCERFEARLEQGGRLAGGQVNHSVLLSMSEQGNLVSATLSQPQWQLCHWRLTSTPACPDPGRLFCLGSPSDAQVVARTLCSTAPSPRTGCFNLETPPRLLLLWDTLPACDLNVTTLSLVPGGPTLEATGSILRASCPSSRSIFPVFPGTWVTGGLSLPDPLLSDYQAVHL